MARLNVNLTSNIAQSGKPLVSEGMLQITPDETSQALPLDLILVLDVSGSMSGAGIQTVIDSTLEVQRNLGPNDRMAIITFNSSAHVHSGWVGANDYIDGMAAGGGTNFNAAISTLLSFLGQHGGDSGKAGLVLFMSDGHAGQTAPDSDVQAICSFGYSMHCLGVTSGADPQHLEHMAELARGRYFDAPTFAEVQQKFGQLFRFGKTVIYSAPVLNINIPSGVTIENLLEVNGAVVAAGPLGKGSHSVTVSNITQGSASQVSFVLKADLIKDGPNQLLDLEFMGAQSTLTVDGTGDTVLLVSAPVNSNVTISRTTAKTTRALKDGNTVAATRGIEQMKTIAKTVPAAGQTVTILQTAQGQTGNIGALLETIGTITVDSTGKTKTREN